jgi:hypothetical protein
VNVAAEAWRKTHSMHIQHLAEQADRPAAIVVTDKGVPQSDSFAKYAAALFNMSHSSVTRFSSFLETADPGLSI